MNKRSMSVIAACVIAVFSVLIWIFFGNEYKVKVIFYDIKDVTVGSPLKYKGLKIGSVSEIEIRSDNKVALVLKVYSQQGFFFKTTARGAGGVL